MDWQLKDQLNRDDYNALKARPVNFGWDGLGELVFHRTYSRGGAETWNDVMERVVNGMYSIQKAHADAVGAPWDTDKVRRSALEAYDLGQRMLWTPPGRGLWAMGTDFVHDRLVPEALNNCAFISSKYIITERGDFFRWIMEMLMLGVGVGFDTFGGGSITVRAPKPGTLPWSIGDSREGWADALRILVDSYLGDTIPTVEFKYDRIRAAGSPIAGFGGVASGPGPLKELLDDVRALLEGRRDQLLRGRDIADIANMIGRCVIAGNVRRSAEIALGPATPEFLNLKNYTVNPYRTAFGWVSNNSVAVIPSGGNLEGYRDLASRMAGNGEPGIVWMENVHRYGRYGDADTRDRDAVGFNPCGEQPLHHREMCTLVEIHLPRVPDLLTFARTIKSAYLYGKTVSLTSKYIGDGRSRDVMERNRRIGLSLTGQAQFVGVHGADALVKWMEYGYQLVQYYDKLYSKWLGVPESIRTTTVKPSGTVSLVTGVTPGVHMAPSRYCVRRVRIGEDSPLVDGLQAAGVPLEEDVVSRGTLVASFVVDAGPGRTEADASMTEQLDNAMRAQEHWSDNGVSVTVKFRPDEVQQIPQALMYAQHRLKSVSFLPADGGDYEQAPYEPISEDAYHAMMAARRPMHLHGDDHVEDRFCDGETCEL